MPNFYGKFIPNLSSILEPLHSLLRKDVVWKWDVESFSNDLQTVLATAPGNNLSEISEYYNNALRQLLDKHAPQKSKVVTIRPAAPWYSKDIAACKKLRRKL